MAQVYAEEYSHEKAQRKISCGGKGRLANDDSFMLCGFSAKPGRLSQAAKPSPARAPVSGKLFHHLSQNLHSRNYTTYGKLRQTLCAHQKRKDQDKNAKLAKNNP